MSAQQQKKTTSRPADKGQMKINEFLYLCMAHWQWFVISLVVCLGLAYIYLRTTTPTYNKTASIMIKTDTNGNSISQSAGMFEDLGLYQGNSTVNDEVALITSPDLMRDVVRRLSLDISYSRPGTFRPHVLYGSQLPVQVQLPDVPENSTASFHLNLDKDGEYEMSDIVLNGRAFEGKTVRGRIGIPQKTVLGTVTVLPGKAYNGKQPTELDVNKGTVKGTAAGFSGSLTATVEEDSWNIVEFSMTDTDPERAEDVIRTLIACYNDRWMQDKRDLADNSSKFIDERIRLLQNELGSVDNDISSFKSANLVPDVDAAASLYMSQASQASIALKDLRNQEYMAKYIRNYLRNSENKFNLLPTNSGLASPNLSAQISQYNAKILERQSLVSQSSASNPLVAELDQQIAAMRGALVASIDNETVALQAQIKSQEGVSGSAQSKIASNPRQAKYLLSVERQQKVKETLYLYLLQKREENQLNQAFTSYNTRIIREADGPDFPVAPVSKKVYLLAFAIGIILPMLIIFIKECSVHVVRGRKDIKGMKIPFAGELPLYGPKQRITHKVLRNNDPTPIVAVQPNSRNAINEAFRVVRTNLEFMFGNDAASRVVMLTSANAGSGKTFVTYNLAKSLAIKNKKVVVVDLDMRKSSLSKYIGSPSTGVADYLANRADDIQHIIKPVADCPNMSIIPVGTTPPNPTELLFSDRLNALISDLRRHYDYVFLDCPPVEVVADASIIAKYADYTIFVIRAGLLDLSMVPVVDELYESGKYPNMSMILNGTLNPKGRYANRYGNPYSYGYGYGSSYRYSND